MRATALSAGSRRAWSGLTAGIVALGVLEAVVLHLIVASLVPSASLTVDVVVGALTVAVCVVVASPLWTAHKADVGRLRLRLGWLARIDVPASRVASAEVVTGSAKPELGVGFDAGTLTMVLDPAADAVRIALSEPIGASFQVFRRVMAHTVIVGVSESPSLVGSLISPER